ncbi:toll-like receptor 3 [Macrosteles quadrilineatus]|uniref:toll-like receptor 3 n=1 Tax=Macrosteles quadrilineatus TaxID=74068 RepID=UPI0023E1A86C|nr:toll-like receptor 3 [Macrosteles quadrilineatus]XP_054271639.1 toll-like receptor 3 [Macrosteles quadrilineatus]XP_054271640.1 toll-like receptor 3 [Macrosteles quadrilineatus]
MMDWPIFSIFLYVSVILPVKSLVVPCNDSFTSKCLCGDIDYMGKRQFVVNCTNTNFQNASVLQNLPSKTQVLIFTGNNINELPMNVFGSMNSFLDLKVVDMSNNNIQDIRGKTYHRVSNVERLILNHNQISISSKEPSHHHPRIFSNFENLVELHLTDAFADNNPEDLASDLHDIFINSELTSLRKLHLEQNEISQFKDPKVFCDLPNLQDLHLGQNHLTGLHFDIDCLPHLRFLDLEYNNIRQLAPDDRSALDSYTKTHTDHGLTIDLSDNSLTGGCSSLYAWMQATKVVVRNKNILHCHELHPSDGCPALLASQVPAAPSSHTGTELFLLVALCATLGLLAYTNWHPIEKQMRPLVDALSHKVHYTNIGRHEEQEMNV